MKQRGQITAFIIVGIVLLLMLGIALFMRGYIAKERLAVEFERAELPSDIAPIQNYMEFCLQELLTPPIFLLGVQGGYLNPPDNALLTTHSVIAYGTIDGQNVLPTREQIQLELEQYVRDSIEICGASLVVFENQGFEIERGSASPAVSIAKDAVFALVEYPVTVTRADTRFIIEEFFVSVPVRLGYVLDELDLLIGTITQNPEYIDYAGLAQRGGHVSVMPFDEETILYSFQDKNSTIDDAPFTFIFAVKDDTANTAPELLFVENMVMTVDELFTYEILAIDAENDKMTFFTDNPDFPIDADTGFLSMTPAQPGIYQVVIGVRDRHGLEDEQGVRIEIVERTAEETIR